MKGVTTSMATRHYLAPPPASMPIWNIGGPRVALGPDERRLLPTYRQWQSDPATLHLLGEAEAPSVESELQRYENQATPGESMSFTIWRRDGDDAPAPIGRAEMRWLDLRNRATELWLLIGPPNLRAQGYGRAALDLLLEFGIMHLGLQSMRARCHSGNPAAARLFAGAGFHPAAHSAEALLLTPPDATSAVAYDLITVDLLASEWLARHEARSS